jgi:hypothetical protein
MGVKKTMVIPSDGMPKCIPPAKPMLMFFYDEGDAAMELNAEQSAGVARSQGVRAMACCRSLAPKTMGTTIHRDVAVSKATVNAIRAKFRDLAVPRDSTVAGYLQEAELGNDVDAAIAGLIVDLCRQRDEAMGQLLKLQRTKP